VTGVKELSLGQPVLLEDHPLPEETDDGEATAEDEGACLEEEEEQRQEGAGADRRGQQAQKRREPE